MLLPSGNLKELERAKEICSISEKANAIDLMSLNEIAYIVKSILKLNFLLNELKLLKILIFLFLSFFFKIK